MARLTLTLACGDYDLTRGLLQGTVVPQGIDLIPLTMPSPERHWRLARGQEFDICEYSLASYLVSREGDLPYTAIPVFPHRRFRHSFVFVRAAAGIERPEDLIGKRVAVRTWQTTAGVWMRGILASEYGVPLDRVRWFAQHEEDLPLSLPPGVRVERLPADANIDTLLVEGELDAALYPEILPSLLRGDPRVRRLWPDSRAVEQAYFRRTGIFPIMHTVVIRNRVLEAHPWVARSLLDAFTRAKQQAYAYLENPRTVALAWVRELLDEQKALLGPDPWVYGFAPNRHVLATFCQYAHAQGLTRRPIDPAELFVATTLDELPKYVE
ncbi:MAG TPA: ABC transporter substrate-binding protein [Chloroflexota bacterium]|jgi:4,5-dihydroxyphthalate decarboxylase|nr:ABC transporter substrate-binding protein [Chloroflexota bacterium]